MENYIEGVDFVNLEPEKYWSFSKSYKGDKRAETKAMIMSCNYLGSEKKDGHYSKLVVDEDGVPHLLSRTKGVNGEYPDKYEWLPQIHSFVSLLPKGTCLLCEVYFPENRGSRNVTTILGALKDKALERQKENKLHLYIFDVWAFNNKSYLNIQMKDRVETLNNEITNLIKENPKESLYVELAKYYEGQDLWNELEKVLSTGGEGVVITKKNGKPEPSKRTARKTLKVKMEIEHTIDAFLDGKYKLSERDYDGKSPETWEYWMNQKTNEKVNKCKYFESANGEPWIPVKRAFYYGWASAVSFSVYKDGKPFHIAWISGITDKMKKEIVEKNGDYTGKCFELSAMELEHIDGAYSLRHGKIIQERKDKAKEDCLYSQIEE